MHKLNPRFFLGLSLGIATLAATATLSGCHSAAQAPASIPDNAGPDPAAANMAPVGNTQPAPSASPLMAVRGIRSQTQPQQSEEQYPPQSQAGAPSNEAISAAQQAAQQGPPSADQNYDYNAPDPDFDAGQQALEEADQAPPPLPEYDQPEAPAPNYLWTPGYWSFAPAGYFWVPGAWCAPPFYGALWTPGYWGFFSGRYLFHHGYWGSHIGFYGGINYGFGYVGTGYYGGYWRGHDFFYNRSVNRVNVNIANVYNRTVVVNNRSRVAFNGGHGGINVRPQAAEIAAMRGPRTPAMASQIANRREAQQNHGQFFNQNRGRPAMVAATRPIMADRTPPRPITRPATETNRGGFGGQENRPGAENRPGLTRPGQPENRPGATRPGEVNNRPQIQPTRPGQPEQRPGQPQVRPNQPETRPGQPENRPGQPENRPGFRPNQPEQRPNQPRIRPTQPENRPAQPRPSQPEVRPETRPVQPENRPQVRPTQPQPRPEQQQPQFRPQPQPQPRPQQPQFRPEQPQSRPAQPQFQPRPQPATRPAPQPRPAQPQARPMPQARPAPAPTPHPEGHPR